MTKYHIATSATINFFFFFFFFLLHIGLLPVFLHNDQLNKVNSFHETYSIFFKSSQLFNFQPNIT